MKYKYSVIDIKPLQDLLKKFNKCFPEELIIEFDKDFIRAKSYTIDKSLIKGFKFETELMFEKPGDLKDFEISIPSILYTSAIINKYTKECNFLLEENDEEDVTNWGLQFKKDRDKFDLVEDLIADTVRLPDHIYNQVMNINNIDVGIIIDKDDMKKIKSNFSANSKFEKTSYNIVLNSENEIEFEINNCQTSFTNEKTLNKSLVNQSLLFNGEYLKTLDATPYKVYPDFQNNKIIFEDINSKTLVCFGCYQD